jgi:hypothetical protein
MYNKKSPIRKYKYSSRPLKASLHIIDDRDDINEDEFDNTYDYMSVGNTKSTINPRVPMYLGNFRTDPNGSYTGRPKDLNEVPVQDADDL